MMAGADGGMAVGVDGARGAWISVCESAAGLQFAIHRSPAALVQAFGKAEVIAVDIPIGLHDTDRRSADALARAFVGGRRASSIFTAPVRGILDAQSQPEASRRHRALNGRGFGAQSFGILPKVRDWDMLLQSNPLARGKVHEVHPEVSFAALGGSKGLLASKKTAEGAELRIELLSRHFDEACIRALLGRVAPAEAARDDVLDALAALWTARRIIAGDARNLPDPPELDSTGLRSAIFY